MTIYTVADILTCVVESVAMFMLFETFFTKRENFPKWIYIAGIFVLSLFINISNLFFNFGMLNAAGMLLSIFAVSFLYKGKASLKLIIAILGLLFIGIAEIGILFLMTLISGLTVSEIVGTPSIRLLGIVVSKMTTLALLNIIRVRFKNREFYIKSSYWFLFFLIFLSSHLAVFLIFKLSYDIDVPYLYNLSVLCSFGLLFSTLFSLYLYEHLAKQNEILNRQRQYEQHIKSQEKHLEDILVTQNQFRRLRHDFSHHLTALQGYFKNEDYNGGLKYLSGMNILSKNSKETVETGNVALDAIINTKKAIAESKNIEFRCKIQIPVNLKIDSTDICIIFGNALDNAIEASEKCDESDRKIEMVLIYENNTVFCKILNFALKDKQHNFKTSKSDKKNHGFGLINIKSALRKYNSEPEIIQTDNQFILKFVIFLKV